MSQMFNDQRVLGVRVLSEVDSTGAPVVPDSYAQSLTYNGDNTVATISFTDGANTWTKTFTYTNGNLTGVSVWVKS